MIARVARSGSVQILVAITCGVVLGACRPDWGEAMKPLSDGFLKVIGLLIPFLMFGLIVAAIARLGRGAGTMTLRMLAYFQCMSLLSLLGGVGFALLMRPGVSGDSGPVAIDWVDTDGMEAWVPPMPVRLPGILETLPGTLVEVFTHGIMLPMLVAAIFCGVVMRWNRSAHGWLAPVERGLELLLGTLRLVIRLAPIAAFGAMAFTVAHYGSASLWPLLKFLVAIYLASLSFILVVLGLVARWSGVRLWRLIVWLKRELLLVISTGSSVAALPGLIGRLEEAGCPTELVRLSLTTGYTLNLAGSNLYVAMALLFLTQFVGVELHASQLVLFVLVGMVTALGSTSVAGSAFLTLAATLSILQFVPVESVGLLLGIERLMKCRSVTNVLGNCVACLALARWQGTLDRGRLAAALSSGAG